jgi:hypothetical protein
VGVQLSSLMQGLENPVGFESYINNDIFTIKFEFKVLLAIHPAQFFNNIPLTLKLTLPQKTFFSVDKLRFTNSEVCPLFKGHRY